MRGCRCGTRWTVARSCLVRCPVRLRSAPAPVWVSSVGCGVRFMIRLSDPAASAVVLIGVADYADTERWQPLPAVRANLADLHATLTSPEHWGLAPERCVTL